PIKIQCGCGQKYVFDVEPVGGRMAYAVQCPACGVDGTAAANEVIAQHSATQPASVAGLRFGGQKNPPTIPTPLPPSRAGEAAARNFHATKPRNKSLVSAIVGVVT